jgi:hypothetical protein
MRRIGLPQPPSRARRRAARWVVPAAVAGVAAILAVAGCAASTSSPAAVDRTVTRAPDPTSSSTTATSTPTAPPTDATPTSSLPARGASGVEGTTVTNRCPVVTDPPCPSIPLTTHVVVTDGGTTVAAYDTGADGRFRIALRPGTYTIKATARPTGVTRPATTTFAVTAGRYASLTLELDSGIR